MHTAYVHMWSHSHCFLFTCIEPMPFGFHLDKEGEAYAEDSHGQPEPRLAQTLYTPPTHTISLLFECIERDGCRLQRLSVDQDNGPAGVKGRDVYHPHLLSV